MFNQNKPTTPPSSYPRTSPLATTNAHVSLRITHAPARDGVPVRAADEGVSVLALPVLSSPAQRAAVGSELQQRAGDAAGGAGAAQGGDARAGGGAHQRLAVQGALGVGGGGRVDAARVGGERDPRVRDDVRQHPVVDPALPAAARRRTRPRELQRGRQLHHVPRPRDGVHSVPEEAPGRARRVHSQAHTRPSRRRRDGPSVLRLQSRHAAAAQGA